MKWFAMTLSGFRWGPLAVCRAAADREMGWVQLRLSTLRQSIDIYITPTGFIRLGTIEKSSDAWAIDSKEGLPPWST